MLYLLRFCLQVASRRLIDGNEVAFLRDQCEIIHTPLVTQSQAFVRDISESSSLSDRAFMVCHNTL